MSMRTPKQRESKACVGCARLKVKCEYDFRGDPCKRCQRLGKFCQVQTPGTHSMPMILDRHSKHVTPNYLQRLESKIDSVSRLLATTSSPARATPPPPPASAPVPAGLSDAVLPSTHEAAHLLEFYSTEMAPLFPFVVIPKSVTVEDLRLEKPILYLVIMMAACQHDMQRQLALAKLVREDINQTVLIRGERSVALLEGLLVYIAWNHTHLQLGQQLIMLEHMAVAIMTDLGLNTDPRSRSKTGAGGLRELGSDNLNCPPRTVEEFRVFLGVFWMCSITKICLKDTYAPRFTKYVDTCCQTLGELKESPNDVYLVHLVRLQQKAGRVGDILYNEDFDHLSGMTAPTSFSISMLGKEIEDTDPGLWSTIPQAPLLQLAHNVLQVYLYKIALNDRLFPPNSSCANLRTNLFFSCLSAIETLLSLICDLPAHTIFSLPYPFWAMKCHALLVLSRLSTVKHSSWNTELVSAARLRDTYIRLAAKLEDVMEIGRRETPVRYLPEILNLMAEKFRSLADHERDSGVVTDEYIMPEDGGMGDIIFDFLDFNHAL